MRVELNVVKGPGEGRSFTFEEPDIFVFGRGLDAHCSIPSDRTISRNHFLVQLSPPHCTVLDLNSSNGTIVNRTSYGGIGTPTPEKGIAQEKPCPVRLRDGDTISAGLTTFRVSVAGAAPWGDDAIPIDVGDHGVPLSPDADGPKLASDEGPAGLVDDTVLVGVSELCLRDRPAPGADSGAAARVPPADIEPDLRGAPVPPEIEGYRFLKVLGVGGMGAVYLAHEAASDRIVAVKTMLPQVAAMPDAFARFEREVSIGTSIKHPNVVEVYRTGSVKDVFYFIMEFVEGTDVSKLMKTCDGCVPVGEAVDIALGALEGLAHAHGLGYVHRDLKPANILLGGEGPLWKTKVADFGLAKSFEQAGLSGLTMEGDICGSIPFMPREQLFQYKWVKPSCDVYSLGATLYYMLTGKRVRRGLDGDIDTPTAVRAITSEAVVPILDRDPSLPGEVAAVIDKSLSDDESQRYRDAGEMREAFRRAVGR